MLKLDHIAVTGQTLAAATDYVAVALGLRPQTGGQHPHFGTHNTLLGLAEGLYVEAIAIDPAAPPPAYPRWFDLDRFTGPPRLTHWIVACDDLDAALAALGPSYGRPVPLTRGAYRWRMAVPHGGVAGYDGMAPMIMQWDGDLHPSTALGGGTCPAKVDRPSPTGAVPGGNAGPIPFRPAH